MSESRSMLYLNISLIILVVIAIGAAVYLWLPRQTVNEPVSETIAQNSAATETEPSATQSATETAPAPVTSLAEAMLADARHLEGESDAPVTIIEFSDFK